MQSYNIVLTVFDNGENIFGKVEKNVTLLRSSLLVGWGWFVIDINFV